MAIWVFMTLERGFSVLPFLILLGCSSSGSAQTPAAGPVPEGRAAAVFAGGCFWCMETAFEGVDGIDSVVSGYTGGPERAPTYSQVSSSRTGHIEAVRVVYDPQRITYARLLDIFWRNIDPTQANGQFCDRGPQYRSAIFTSDDEEQRLARQTKRRVAQQLRQRIDTRILAAATFWVAEEYHQDYYRKNPVRYQTYRTGCGRDRRLQQLWGASAGH